MTIQLSTQLDITEAVPRIQRMVSRQFHLADKDRSFVEKPGNDYTTLVDRQVETLLKAELQKYFPAIGFLGEEGSGVAADLEWVVDPTDGTGVFGTGGDYYSCSIALIDRTNKRVPFGCVYQPARDRQFVREDFSGYPGTPEDEKSAILIENSIENGLGTRLLRPSQTRGWPEVMYCGIAPSRMPNAKQLEAALEALKVKVQYDNKRAYGAIPVKPASGSSALFCCDIANGIYHAAILFGQKAWDLAAGALIARDAGCIVTCGSTPSNLHGGNLEEAVATCTKDTEIAVGIYCNKYVQEQVEKRLPKDIVGL